MTTAAASILVPLDGSHNAENAVPVAALLARLYDAPVHFIHVVDETEGVRGPQDLDRARSAFASYALDFARRSGIDPQKADAEVGWGPPAATILAAAKGARFIVIASHGRGGFKATFIGSVADKVVRGATVPVLIVPAVDSARAIETKLVLVAVDGSPEAEKGLAAARDFAARMGTKVALVRAVSVPPPVGVEFAYYPPDLLTTMEQAAHEYVAGVAQPGEQTLVVHGPSSSVIVDAATELDAGLVVMTAHGRGLAARLALGSTTDRIMHSLHRPLLVVRAPQD